MKQEIIRSFPEVEKCGFINSEACATVRVLEITGDEAGATTLENTGYATTETLIAQKRAESLAPSWGISAGIRYPRL